MKHLPLEDGAQHEVGQDAGEERLGGLDGLGEGDGAGAEGDDGAGVAERVCRANGDESLEPRRRDLGGL